MAVFVTGGAGYIGSHTCIALMEAGYDVVVMDNFDNSHPEAISRVESITQKKVRLYQDDVRNEEALRKVFSENRIDAVIHFAGLKSVNESVSQPVRYYDNNLISTIRLLEVMEEFGVRRFVFSSSATVYGMQKEMPVAEDRSLGAINPYGRTKLFIEEILRDVAHANPSWHIALLRYFNPIGAHESGLIGEDPQGIPNNLMPYISQVAMGKLPRLTVYGNDYNTPDGTGVRDYIHVVDLALGHVKAVEWTFAHAGCEPFNLGTGRGVSVLELINAFERATGAHVPYVIGPRRAGDPDMLYSDPTRAKNELDWVATRTVEQMCADSWRWQSKNPNGYQE